MTTEEKIKDLISLAEKQGYITYDKINETFSDPDLSGEGLDKIYTDLLLAGVQIIDQPAGED